MQFLLRCVLLAALFSPLAQAAENCDDKPECWPEGSAMRTGLTLLARLKAAESQLSGAHDKLIAVVRASSIAVLTVDERLIIALKNQQAAWLIYRGEDCALVGALTGAGGSWPSTYTTRCEANQTVQRLRRVETAIRCIENKPADKRVPQQDSCLSGLVVLVNR